MGEPSAPPGAWDVPLLKQLTYTCQGEAAIAHFDTARLPATFSIQIIMLTYFFFPRVAFVLFSLPLDSPSANDNAATGNHAVFPLANFILADASLLSSYGAKVSLHSRQHLHHRTNTICTLPNVDDDASHVPPQYARPAPVQLSALYPPWSRPKTKSKLRATTWSTLHIGSGPTARRS